MKFKGFNGIEKVLFVDNDDSVQRAARQSFENRMEDFKTEQEEEYRRIYQGEEGALIQNFEIIGARNLRDAIQEMDVSKPCMVMTDMQMERKDSGLYVAYEAIRRNIIPIVVSGDCGGYTAGKGRHGSNEVVIQPGNLIVGYYPRVKNPTYGSPYEIDPETEEEKELQSCEHISMKTKKSFWDAIWENFPSCIFYESSDILDDQLYPLLESDKKMRLNTGIVASFIQEWGMHIHPLTIARFYSTYNSNTPHSARVFLEYCLQRDKEVFNLDREDDLKLYDFSKAQGLISRGSDKHGFSRDSLRLEGGK